MEWADFPRVAALGIHLRVVAQTESTNRFLSDNPGAALSWSAVVTDHQTAGRGRSGRSWESPAGLGVAVSIQLPRDIVPAKREASWLGWVSLIAGSSLAEALSLQVDAEVAVKWPNDVYLQGKKVAGILGEVTPAGDVIVGMGINLFYRPDQLPTPEATSLSLHGVLPADTADVVLAGFLETFTTVTPGIRGGVNQWTADWVTSWLGTLGRDVRVTTPGGETINGVAVALGPDGSLIVGVEGSSRELRVAVGDIEHLRHR